MSNSNDGNNGGFFNNPTRRVGSGATTPTVKKAGSNDKTHLTSAEATEDTASLGINPKTRRVRPSSSQGDVTEPVAAQSGNNYHPEFVVGWLVVISGPGMGMSKPLGYGMNPVGREEDAGVRLDFGDEEISRNAHCQIAYDHKNKKFYIQHGGGQNLTYLGDQPVLSSCELYKDAIIAIGNTTLKFVQLCDESFDWEQGV